MRAARAPLVGDEQKYLVAGVGPRVRGLGNQRSGTGDDCGCSRGDSDAEIRHEGDDDGVEAVATGDWSGRRTLHRSDLGTASALEHPGHRARVRSFGDHQVLARNFGPAPLFPVEADKRRMVLEKFVLHCRVRTSSTEETYALR
ncbi:hypothetical protein ABIB34_003906 [Rhodococcus sp. UYP5]